jgi:hypothetical protein
VCVFSAHSASAVHFHDHVGIMSAGQPFVADFVHWNTNSGLAEDVTVLSRICDTDVYLL